MLTGNVYSIHLSIEGYSLFTDKILVALRAPYCHIQKKRCQLSDWQLARHFNEHPSILQIRDSLLSLLFDENESIDLLQFSGYRKK